MRLAILLFAIAGCAPPRANEPARPLAVAPAEAPPSPTTPEAAADAGFESSVKPGNQVALGKSATAWATYLGQLHRAIHPIFADGFLEKLRKLPTSDPMNNHELVVRVEMVIDRDGHIAKIGIVRSSGVTKFDVGALDSISGAAPFPKPPVEILSSDERAYLQWDLYRDERSCSTAGASPFILEP